MVSSTMDLLIKRTLSLSIKLSEEFPGQFLPTTMGHSTRCLHENKFLNVYEMFIVEVVKGFQTITTQVTQGIP